MQDRGKLIGSLVAIAAALAGCSALTSQSVGEVPSSAATTLASASTAPVDDTRLKDRVASLKTDLPRKLARKPKYERDATIFAWQDYWAGRVAMKPFDEPQSRQIHFLAKRLPEGQTAIGPDNYTAALDQVAQMPVYSTLQRGFVSQPGSSATAGGVVSNQIGAAALGAGGSWTARGPGNIGGRTRALLIHPTTPTTMWAAGVAGGIWKSTDSGATWTPKADLLVNIAVNSMILDPRNPNTLYAGTGEGFFNGDSVRGAGIMKSTDGGETWSQLPATATSDFFYVQKIAMSRGSSQRLYAATRTGVFRSTDAGASWTKVLDGAAVNGCMDLAIQTDRPLANVFASCGTFTQSTVYRALDTGSAQTWTPVLSNAGMGRTSLALAPSNQNIVYALSACTGAGCGNFTDGLQAVYRSPSSGAAGSWTTQVTNASPTTLNRLLLSNPVYGALTQCGFGTTAFLNQGWYDNIIAVDPADPNIVWAGGIDLFRSDDGGKNWGQASHWWFTPGVDPEYNHADQHNLVFHPQYNGTTNKIMYSTNDGGIHLTADARAPVSYSPDPITPASPVCGNTAAGVMSWQDRNNGYQVTQFYHGASYPDGATYFGGTQDNGTLRGSNAAGPDAWATIRGGDGGYVAINPNNTNMIWVENTGLSIQRSTNGGTSYSAFTTGITEPGGNFLFITPFAQDPSNPANMWIGGARPWRTTQATANPTVGNIWTQASSTFFASRTTAIGVSPLDSNRVYFGVGSGGGAVNGTIFTTGAALTSTSATPWTSSKPRADANVISWIAGDPVAAGTVYATVSTFNSATGVGHVFKSTNFGATWTSIDGAGATGIPDVPVHTIVIDPTNTSRLYVGTDIGVFVSLDGGATWARENTGFANVIVEALILNNSTRTLYAFSHGRSLFTAQLP